MLPNALFLPNRTDKLNDLKTIIFSLSFIRVEQNNRKSDSEINEGSSAFQPDSMTPKQRSS